MYLTNNILNQILIKFNTFLIVLSCLVIFVLVKLTTY